MAHEEHDRSAEEREKRVSRPPSGEARSSEAGKSSAYTRPVRSQAPRSSESRGQQPEPGTSAPSRPLGSSSRPYQGKSAQGNSAPRGDGDTRPNRGDQGRPDSAGQGRNTGSRAAQGGYQGKPASRSDAEARRDGSPRTSGGYQGRPSNARGRPSSERGDSANERGGERKTGYQGKPGNERGSQGRTGYLGKGSPRDTDEPTPRNEGLVRKAPVAPDIPDEVTFDLLDKAARARLRTLSKDNAEDVGRHLIMAGRLLDIDPERAYQHAQVAVARGGRVDIVREAAALTAYASGRYADALREFRTVRRLNGSSEHLALMADCERGLGRPERAIALAQEPGAKELDAVTAVELQIVIAGARMDMGDPEAALMTLGRIQTKEVGAQARVAEAKVAVLRALGRDVEADELEASLPAEGADEPTWSDEVFLYDVEELPEPEEEPVASESEDSAAESDETSDADDRNA